MNGWNELTAQTFKSRNCLSKYDIFEQVAIHVPIRLLPFVAVKLFILQTAVVLL